MDNAEALGVLRDGMAIRQAEWASRPDVVVGDFTYAWGPRIKTWGEGAKCYIGAQRSDSYDSCHATCGETA